MVVEEVATTLALDVAGFTALTDHMSTEGSRGTERLSRMLRSYFDRVTELVVDAGGDPVAFGGDSLTIVFDGTPESTIQGARVAAHKIQQVTAALAGEPTTDGMVDLQVRMGIARGRVTTGVARSRHRLLPVHIGAGLDRAHAAQESAEAGSIAIEASVMHVAKATRYTAATVPTRPAASKGDGGTHRLLHPLQLERLRQGHGLLESHRMVSMAFVRFPPVKTGALEQFLTTVADLVDRVNGAGGEVVQVSGGDKGVLAMAVFGAPTSHPDDPLRAVHTVVDLQRQIPAAAFGVATGPVFTAMLGSRVRMFPTHTGPAVNLAARLSQLADPGHILVDAPTWQGGSRSLRPAGRPRPYVIKGYAAPIEVHSVAGWRRSAPRPMSTEVPLLVGRERELGLAESMLAPLPDRWGGSLVVTGPPGIGKTRVVQEVSSRAQTRGCRVIAVDVADHPRGHRAGLWRDLVGALIDLRRNAPRHRWLEELGTALLNRSDQLAVLGSVLAVGDPMPPSLVTAESRQHSDELARLAFARLLQNRSTRGPVLIVLENVDRLDDTSVDLLSSLEEAAQESGVGLLLTAGQDGTASMQAFLAQLSVLSLEPLNLEDTESLAEEAWRQTGGGRAPAWLGPLVRTRTGGNPLLVDQVARTLYAQWKPGNPPPVDHTGEDSADRILLSQLDRLPVTARELLTGLAVAHRPSDVSLLQSLIRPQPDAATIYHSLALLLADRLVTRVEGGGEDAYRLSHGLLQQVIYGSTSHAERERLHRQLIDVLAESGADPVEIAHHVQPLADRELARRWFAPAARAARNNWDLTAALRWYQALEPLTSGSEQAEVQLEILEVLLIAGRANEVLQQTGDSTSGQRFGPGGEPDRESADQLLAARWAHVLAEAAYSCGQWQRAGAAAARVMRLTEGLDEPRYQRAGELLTLVRCQQGHLGDAVQTGHELVRRAQRKASPAAEANALAALAVALVMSGEPVAATERYEAALVAATTAGDVVRQVHILSDLAGCAFMIGEHRTCIELLTQARDRAEAIGYRRHLAFNLGNEAQLRAALGDPYAPACASAAIERNLELGDLATAADALHTWLTAWPSRLDHADYWRRLIGIDVHLERSHKALGESADLAVILARSGQRALALDAAQTAAAGAHSLEGHVDVAIRHRAEFARLLAHAAHPLDSSPVDATQLVDGLDRLLIDSPLSDRDGAEIALERWRVTRSDVDRLAAATRLRAAAAVEPSAQVREWFRVLDEPLPPGLVRLPPPAGFTGSRKTRRDFEQALTNVEHALHATGKRSQAPVAERSSSR